MVIKDRMTASIEGDFVVFLIGMRINQFWKIHKWLPVAAAMPKMLKELYTHPEMGLLHHEMWFSRTIILVQYWRSMDQLLSYAKNKDAKHLPAWSAFNKAVGQDGSVGIWHETYSIAKGHYETIYGNMPPFGLGRAGKLEKAVGRRNSASDRLKEN
jgi:GH15 family glucan-1,4-alpha-glucosidase